MKLDRHQALVSGQVPNVNALGKYIATPEAIVADIIQQTSPSRQHLVTNVPQIRSHIPHAAFLDVSSDMRHNTCGHTLDDALLVDEANGIYIVADGVTREFCENQDAAWKVSQAFSRLMHRHICEQLTLYSDPVAILESALRLTSVGVADLNRQMGLGNDFLRRARGSCAAAVLMRHGEEYFMFNLADCQVAAFTPWATGSELSQLTAVQTTASEALRKTAPNRMQMLELHRSCGNRIEGGAKSKFGYGIMDGNPDAVRFVDIRQAVCRNAFVVFSDGFLSLFDNKPLARLSGLTPHEYALQEMRNFLCDPVRFAANASALIGMAINMAPNHVRCAPMDDVSLIVIKSRSGAE